MSKPTDAFWDDHGRCPWDELVSWQDLARSAARIARETRRGSPDGCAQKFQTETVLREATATKAPNQSAALLFLVSTFQLQEQTQSSSPQWMERTLAQRGGRGGVVIRPLSRTQCAAYQAGDPWMMRETLSGCFSQVAHVFSSQVRHRKKRQARVQMHCFRTSALSRGTWALSDAIIRTVFCSERGPSVDVHVDACC